MSDNDIVKVRCYGTTKTYKRRDAIDFYEEGIMCSDGSERERYVHIVMGLRAGLLKVNDGVD